MLQGDMLSIINYGLSKLYPNGSYEDDSCSSRKVSRNHIKILLSVMNVVSPPPIMWQCPVEDGKRIISFTSAREALKSTHFHNTPERELVILAFSVPFSPSPVRCDSLLINLSDIKWSHLSCRHSLFTQLLAKTEWWDEGRRWLISCCMSKCTERSS